MTKTMNEQMIVNVAANVKCECDDRGELKPGWEWAYDKVLELPFVTHAPGECKCVNNLQEHERDGKKVILCSCCC